MRQRIGWSPHFYPYYRDLISEAEKKLLVDHFGTILKKQMYMQKREDANAINLIVDAAGNLGQNHLLPILQSLFKDSSIETKVKIVHA